LLIILIYLKTYPLQAVQGRLFEIGQWQDPPVDSCLVSSPPGDVIRVGGYPEPIIGRVGQAHWGSRGRYSGSRRTNAGAANPSPSISGGSYTSACLPSLGYNGTEHRIRRPQNPTEQTRCYSSKRKCHTVKNVLLINVALMILFLSDTYPGSTHDKRIAQATLCLLPAGGQLLQDLCFPAFTPDQVEIIMPTRKPQDQPLMRVQKAANRWIARRRMCTEHVSSSVKRYRIVHDTNRLRKAGVRD
jgi:hypothetical protein